MKRTSLYMDEVQIAQIQELAERVGGSFAEHVRRASDLHLAINAQTGSVAEAVAQAMQTFDDARTPERAVERALVRWLHDKEANSLRGGQKRTDEKLDRILEILEAERHANDFDHA